MFETFPDENTFVALAQSDEGGVVGLDPAGFTHLESYIGIINATTGAQYASFAEMCEHDPSTAYDYLRSILLRIYDTDEIEGGLEKYLHPRDTLDVHGEWTNVGLELTDEDRKTTGTDMARLVLHRLLVTPDNPIDN